MVHHLPIVDISPLLISIFDYNVMLFWVLDIYLKLSFPLFKHGSGASTLRLLITGFGLGYSVLVQVLVRNGFVNEACGFAFTVAAAELTDCQVNSLKLLLR